MCDNFNQTLSIYIPNIYVNFIGKIPLKDVFLFNHYGIIERIDYLHRKNKKISAFVHFRRWFYNRMTIDIQKQILAGGMCNCYVEYTDFDTGKEMTWYWNIYKNTSPRSRDSTEMTTPLSIRASDYIDMLYDEDTDDNEDNEDNENMVSGDGRGDDEIDWISTTPVTPPVARNRRELVVPDAPRKKCIQANDFDPASISDYKLYEPYDYFNDSDSECESECYSVIESVSNSSVEEGECTREDNKAKMLQLMEEDTNAFVEIDGVYIKTLEADNDSLRVSIKELKRELEEMRNKYSVLEKEKEFELQLAKDDIDCLKNANSYLKDNLTALEEITFVA
jgi:hypothetical protein